MYAIDRPEVQKFATEKRLEVKVEANTTKSHLPNDDADNHDHPYPSLYFRTCLEELTRNYISYTIAEEDSPILEVEDCKPPNASSMRFPSVEQLDAIEVSHGEQKEDSSTAQARFMQVYHPHAVPQVANFRRVPANTKHIVSDWSCGYSKLLVNVGPKFKIRYNKRVFFEPMFGSMSLYSMNKKIDTDMTKISECFHFDATPQSLRSSYENIYKTDLNPQSQGKDVDSQVINPLSDCSRCMFCIPSNIIETHDIYLIVHVSKILTGDPDKALHPYINPDKKSFLGNPSSDTLLKDSIVNCNRLHRFRQSVGVCAVKVFDSDGSVNKEKVGMVAPIYPLRNSCSDVSLKHLIQEIHAEEKNASPNRLPISTTELDMCLTLLNLGEGGDLSSIPVPEGMPCVRTANIFRFLPSQYLTEASANDYKWHSELGKEVADLISVKTVLPLLHPSCRLSDSVLSGFRANIDNSLFLYPSAIENIAKNFRNITVKVQLVEFEKGGMPGTCKNDKSGGEENSHFSFHALKNIYNTTPGDYFCHAAYTTVSYHKSNPEFGDEIKIRLPLNLGNNHSLFFQFYHVHVKNKSEGRRASIFSSKSVEDDVLTLIGTGHLPLLVNGSSLVPDGEHFVEIFENIESVRHGSATSDNCRDSASSLQSLQTTNSVRLSARRSLSSGGGKLLPTFTLRTKSLSSFSSQDEELQNFLTCHPPPLGHLPSLTPSMMKNIEFTVLPKEYVRPQDEKGSELPYNSPLHSVNEDILKEKTLFLARLGSSSKATKLEVCKHFFGIMRQLIRSMCGGGTGGFSITFANPFLHSELRCASFLAMLRVFSVVTPNHVQSSSHDSDEASTHRPHTDFLRSYIDHMFDEEVYTYLSPSKRRFSAGAKARKNSAKFLGVKLAGLFGKGEESEEINRTDDEGNEHEVAFVDHILQQVETIILQGSILSAIGKVTHDLISNGDEFVDSRLSNDMNINTAVPRWWKGCSEKELFLAEITQSPRSLQAAVQSARRNVNSLKESVVIDPILSVFDKLDGFSLRSFAIEEELRRAEKNSSNESDLQVKKHDKYNYLTLQWWPWMYEVVSYQWIALLHIFQEQSSEKAGGINEEISMIQEVDEEEVECEDSATIGASGLNWNADKSYPLTELQDLFDKKNEIRVLLINHGPILLAMITKSIALRIFREQKNTPVIMDKDFMNLMVELLDTLAREVHSKGTSLLPARNLNIAISHFLREMFALIAPLQSAKLVYAYFLSSRKNQRVNFDRTQKVQVNQITDRFYFLKELVLMDHFFAFNFPLHLGSPYKKYVFKAVFSLQDLVSRSSQSKIRGIASPPSHWLTHLFIYEIMCDYDSLEKNLKESAMKLMRSLVVRLSFDKRFQSREYRHRIAAMFLPLLSFLVEDVKRITELSRGSDERRDGLSLLLYILQDLPDYLAREEFRNMMKIGHISPITLKRHRNVATGVSAGAASDFLRRELSDHQHLPIFDLIATFHLVVDTFEFPLTHGGDEGDISVCLSPSINVEGMDVPHNAPPAGKATIGTRERMGTNDALSMLEDMHAKRGKRAVRRRSSGDKTSGIDNVNDLPVRNANSLNNSTQSRSTSDFVVTIRPNQKTGIKHSLVGMLNGLNAVKQVCKESSALVLHHLRIIFDEGMRMFEPMTRFIYSDTTFGFEMSRIICDSLNLLLHMLHTKQCEETICCVYMEATKTLMTLGGKSFIKSLVEDTLQYWLRQVLLHCASQFARVREAAASFFGNLLFSCFDGYGSLRPVSLIVFGVLRDVIDEVEKLYKNRPHMLESGEYLLPFNEALKSARGVISSKECVLLETSKVHSGTQLLLQAIDQFFASVSNLLGVYSFINLKLDYLKVSFDWKGGNGLDTIDYEDSSQKRNSKHVGFNAEDLISNALEGVDLEDMLDQLINAAKTLNEHGLPRNAMYLLENLARIQDMSGNDAEAGVVRWEIYMILVEVEKKIRAVNCRDKGSFLNCYWCPRPPLKLVENSGTFTASLRKILDAPEPTIWETEVQFYKHMVTVLKVCFKRFKDAKLTFLAERAIQASIKIFRREGVDANESLALISKAYSELTDLYTQSSVGNTTFAMGTFYRVLFLGKGVSEKIRNKEYVIRNADYLHLSEFQTLIKKNLMIKHVSKEVNISVLPDTAPPPDDNSSDAYIVMTALKPIFDGSDDVESKNCLRRFQYSLPFTQGGKAHAKTIDQQWKRTIYVEVAHSFPFMKFRQIVSRRSSRILSPIEVAIDDIQDRNIAMRQQLQLRSSRDQIFINNLMRIVQGTVAPQVNAGAAEVARTFLAPLHSNNEEFEKTVPDPQVKELKMVLVDFLKRSKLLLERARQVLGNGRERKPRLSITKPELTTGTSDSTDISDQNDAHPGRVSTGSNHSVNSSNSGVNQPPPPPESPALTVENHYTIWQKEMDKGFDMLFEVIFPFVSDNVSEADIMGDTV